MGKRKIIKKYYALAGPNAYGIFTNLQSLNSAANYIPNYEWEMFGDIVSARIWATERFLSLQPEWDPHPTIDLITRLDWCYHKKKPIRKR